MVLSSIIPFLGSGAGLTRHKPFIRGKTAVSRQHNTSLLWPGLTTAPPGFECWSSVTHSRYPTLSLYGGSVRLVAAFHLNDVARPRTSDVTPSSHTWSLWFGRDILPSYTCSLFSIYSTPPYYNWMIHVVRELYRWCLVVHSVGTGSDAAFFCADQFLFIIFPLFLSEITLCGPLCWHKLYHYSVEPIFWWIQFT